MLSSVYERLPEPLKPVAKSAYRGIHPNRKTADEIEDAFVAAVFDSRAEFDRYVEEFEAGPASTLRNRALEEYAKLTGRENLTGIDLTAGARYYALVRKLEPQILVETGVCNGISTLCLLLALDQNGHGRLHSIDYPVYADASLEEYNDREDVFDDHHGAVIPSDKEPGWIIPDELMSRWDLTTGRSQRELPRLLMEFDEIDFFAHDSEHTVPCMTFEYELAWEWLSPGGVIVSDDIGWNDAFQTFADSRAERYGQITANTGYILKDDT